MSVRNRQRLSPEVRREQLLGAATRAFLRRGYHATHVEQIVEEAGVSRGTFYAHFEGKHAVFAALVDRMLQIFLDARPALPEPEVLALHDAETVLRLSYREVLETFWRHRRLLRLLLEEAVGLEKGFAARVEEHFQAWHQRVRQTLDLFQERGVAHADLDKDLAADLVLGMVERVTRRHLLGPKKPDLDRLVEALVSFELRGIASAA